MKVLFYLLLIVVMFLLLSKTEINSSGIKIKEPLYGAGILLILLAIFLIELNAKAIGYKEGVLDANKVTLDILDAKIKERSKQDNSKAKEEIIKILSTVEAETKKETEQINKDL